MLQGAGQRAEAKGAEGGERKAKDVMSGRNGGHTGAETEGVGAGERQEGPGPVNGGRRGVCARPREGRTRGGGVEESVPGVCVHE